MNVERFEQLKESVIEAGKIMRGDMAPSREFIIEVSDKPERPRESWAICVDSYDHDLLVPRKIYSVTFVDSGVWVRDENGEMTSCDSEDFLPIAFEPEVPRILAEAA